jgi:Domain of unknown function (DUF4263)
MAGARMKYKVRLNSTSANSAEGDPVVLRETKTTRLVFCPTVVNNPNDPDASVRGRLIHQRRAAKTEDWTDIKAIPLSSLRADEAVKLELSSEMTSRLVDGLNAHYVAHSLHGIELGLHEHEIDLFGVRDLFAFIRGDTAAAQALGTSDGVELVANIISSAARNELLEPLSRSLESLGPEARSHLNAALRLSELRKALNLWEENKENPDEEFWQEELKQRSWILCQVFSQPMILVRDKVYVGGKDFTNRHGKITDYLFKNTLTKNAAIVEIKTPMTELVQNRAYRQDVFSPGKDIVGGTIQVIDQRDSLMKNYPNLSRGTPEFEVNMPACILVAGKVSQLSELQKKSFEFYRSNSRAVELIAFDELFSRVEGLVQLFEIEEE